MSGNQRHNNASTVNLSKDYIVWCKGKVVGSYKDGAKAKEFLRQCPLGSYIQYPMGAIRDHQIARERKSAHVNAPIDKNAWDRMRQKQNAQEEYERKLAARAEIAAEVAYEESPEEIAARVFAGERSV